MTIYYKATRPDGTSFHDKKTKWQVGRITRLGEAVSGHLCGSGVLHAATRAAETLVGGEWPCRLFVVEPRSALVTSTEHPYKVGAGEWKVVREIPAWKALGPNGKQVAALLERCKTLTSAEAERLAAALGAALDAARYAAGYAACDAARCAARDAAGDAALGAAQYAARYAARGAARYAARGAAGVAALALVVKGIISSEHFQALYGPWQSVIEGGEQ